MYWKISMEMIDFLRSILLGSNWLETRAKASAPVLAFECRGAPFLPKGKVCWKKITSCCVHI